jgi:hypothetical protein
MHPTHTPFAATTHVLVRDVGPQIPRTAVTQNATKSHEGEAQTKVHLSRRTVATRGTTREDVTHANGATTDSEIHDVPTQVQTTSRDASTKVDTHTLATTFLIHYSRPSLLPLLSQHTRRPSPSSLFSSIPSPSGDPTTCPHESTTREEGDDATWPREKEARSCHSRSLEHASGPR